MKPLSILLASNSPRRRQFLDWLGCQYRVHPVDIDETKFDDEEAAEYVTRVAGDKAQAAIPFVEPGEILLCADTIVADGNKLLGKPVNAEDARKILQHLRGKEHRVYSALVLYEADTHKQVREICCSIVPMRNYSDDEINKYIASGDPLDKAGAYAIQHVGFHPVEHFNGCFASVMGLPLCHLKRALMKFDLSIQTDISYTCYQKMDYHCNIHQDILAGK